MRLRILAVVLAMLSVLGSASPALIGLVAVAFSPQAFSQVPVAAKGRTLSGEWAIEQLSRERWMHGRQQSRFTPRHESDDWVFVDSIRADGVSRHIWLALARNAMPETAVLDVGPGGHVARLRFTRAAPPPAMAHAFGDSSFQEFLRRAPGGGVSLHETRAWDLVPSMPSGAPHVGLSWRDTLAHVAADGPYRQAFHGIRVSRIVGQRTVAGHELWVVRDSAVVRYEERYPERERTIAGAHISRTASGTIVGVHLWDPGLPVIHQLDDTTRLAGVAILRYPDGRSFRTPARFERTRHRALFDAAGYAARSAERYAAISRTMGGMVLVPEDSLQQRLTRGDVSARDSLIAAWRHATDPDAASRIFRALVTWSGRDAATRARLDSVRVAAGDTTFLYQRLADRAYDEHPFDAADVRAMLPFMRSPQLPWSFGLSRDMLYENLVQSLTTWPPVAASGARNSACAPAACELLGRQWRAEGEPRLQDVGLVARFVTDPARWTDTVLALDGPRHLLLHRAAWLARGAGALWDAASHSPIPPPNSDWRGWLQWMDGKDSSYLAWARQSSLPPRMKIDTMPHVRFEESHATAIRFTEARTGRDIVAELQRGYDSASSDSARLVFGSMLQGLGRLHLGETEVAEAFRSGDATRISLARSALAAGFAHSASMADSSVAVPLLQRLLAAIVDSAPLWPRRGEGGAPGRGETAILHMPRGRVLIDSLGLPERIRGEWAPRVALTSRAAWNESDVRQGGVFYMIKPITTWGPFARVEMTAEERFPRKPEETPRAYASGVTWLLMYVDGEWAIVGESRWVT